MLKDKKLAVLGAGKLGETLIKGLIEAGVTTSANVTVTAAHQRRLDQMKERFGVPTTLSNAEAARSADVLILAVKPQAVPAVLADISDIVRPPQVLISVAASVSAAFIEKHLANPIPVIRAMPNTPCLVDKGMTGIAPGTNASRQDLDLASYIFNAVGRTVIVDEKHMDAITGLSASGPAFIYIVIESLSEALSNALMEAMGCGCCPVASDTGGNPELVTDCETGLLFPAGDAAALADRLGRLVDGAEYRRGLAARAERRMREQFTRERAAQAMGEIYAEFLG